VIAFFNVILSAAKNPSSAAAAADPSACGLRMTNG
jgi:hypothetical protein